MCSPQISLLRPYSIVALTNVSKLSNAPVIKKAGKLEQCPNLPAFTNFLVIEELTYRIINIP